MSIDSVLFAEIVNLNVRFKEAEVAVRISRNLKKYIIILMQRKEKELLKSDAQTKLLKLHAHRVHVHGIFKSWHEDTVQELLDIGRKFKKPCSTINFII